MTPSTTIDPRQLEAVTFVRPGEPTRSASVFGFEYGTAVEPAEVLTTVGAVLGEPDHDTGWQPIPQSLACKGDIDYRSVLWDDLRIVLERQDGGDARLGAWSLGAVELSYSPPLAAEIGDPSGVTSSSGLGIGSPASAIADEGFSMVGDEGDSVLALAGISPVVFEVTGDTVSALSIEDNDCFVDDANM